MRGERLSSMRRGRRDIRMSWLTLIEKFFQLEIHDDVVSVCHRPPRLAQPVVRPTTRPEAVADRLTPNPIRAAAK
jgi:hypothetical protein